VWLVFSIPELIQCCSHSCFTSVEAIKLGNHWYKVPFSLEFFLEKQVALEYLFTEILLYMVNTLKVISQCLFCTQEGQGLFGYPEVVNAVESFSA